MLAIYRVEGNRIACSELEPEMPVPEAAVWVDLRDPTPAEVATVEHALDIDVPTLDEMREIEVSSRLRVEDGAMIMTAMVLAQSETERPICAAITFMLARNRLITLRYADPSPSAYSRRGSGKSPATSAKAKTSFWDYWMPSSTAPPIFSSGSGTM